MINIIAIGNKMPHWIDDGIKHYLKQLKNIKIITIKNSNKNKENKDLLAKLSPNNYNIILDETGINLSSLEFADKINKIVINNEINFIIGGADGLNDFIKDKADYIMSLSKATMPHSLARLVLIEQIYRAFSINKNHPYHRG